MSSREGYVPTPQEWIHACAVALHRYWLSWDEESRDFEHDHGGCLHSMWPDAHAVAAEVIGTLRDMDILTVRNQADGSRG